jgi:rhodanese-related sulfurtransferase
MKKFFPVFLVALLFGWIPSVSSCHSEGGGEEFLFISTQDLSKGIKEKTLFVVDNNTPELYQKKHIPSAVFMDHHEPNAAVLPKDKNTALVFYCKNTRCTASHAGARFAKSQGYSNIRVYPEGIDGWETAGMPLEAAN